MYYSPLIPENLDKYDEYRLHMECLYSIKLVEYDISLRILLPLEKAGIVTIGDLVSRTRKELAAIPQLGAAALAKIDAFLDYVGLELKKG